MANANEATALSPGRLRILSEKLAAGKGLHGKLSVVRALTKERWSANGHRDVIAVPMAKLNGERIYIRPQTTDLSNAVNYLKHGIHRPPPSVGDPRRIVELGTNMGAGLTALALEHPEAQLVGIEPDEGNFAVAALNTARFGDRVRLVRGAIWDHEADLVFDPEIEAGEHGIAVRDARPADEGARRLRGLTLDTFVDLAFPGEGIDYMHVTIEGSEPRVFAAGGAWPDRVRSLRVEAHPYFGYPVEECVAQLESLGYRAEPAPSPPDKWVFATR